MAVTAPAVPIGGRAPASARFLRRALHCRVLRAVVISDHGVRQRRMQNAADGSVTTLPGKKMTSLAIGTPKAEDERMTPVTSAWPAAAML